MLGAGVGVVQKRGPWFFAVLWILCLLAGALALWTVFGWLLGVPRPDDSAWHATAGLLPLIFCLPATLIITRQPRNVVGWLLLVPGLIGLLAYPVDRYLFAHLSAAPPLPFGLLYPMVFLNGSGWLGLIFPLLMIPLFFPTGRLLGPRWRWTVWLALGLVGFFLFWAVFSRQYQVEGAAWVLTIPWGVISDDFGNRWIFPIWLALLLVLTLASVYSIYARYRRAQIVERQQIKWLLYACVAWTLVYAPSLVYNTELLPDPVRSFFDWIFLLLIVLIPASITIALLRYRLYDIDVIIRLTLVYTLVSGLLALLYAGGVVLLQQAFRALTGQGSPAAVVLTTLGIAALFQPLRARVQTWIDRRFYRQKYNVGNALAAFAAAAGRGSDLEALTAMLIEVVQANLQPDQLSLYLRPLRDGEPPQGRNP